MDEQNNIDYGTTEFKPGANNIPNGQAQAYPYADNVQPQFTAPYILPPEMQARKDIKSAVMQVGLILIVFITAQFLMPSAYGLMLGLFGRSSPSGGSVEYQVFYVVFYIVAFFTPTLTYICRQLAKGEKIFRFFGSKNECAVKERRSSRARDYICLSFFTLATSFSGMLISQYIEVFINSFGIATNLELFTVDYQNTTARIINAAVVCIVAPVLEELLFRGAILHSLRRFGDTFAIVCSAVVFGLMHGNIYQIPHAVIGGIVFGYIVVKRGNILSAIILHMINNVFATAIDYIVSLDFIKQYSSLDIVIQNVLVVIIMLIGILLLWYYLKHEPFRLDSDIETSKGKKADAFLPGLTSYKLFFSNAFIIIFIIYSFVNICATFEFIELTEAMLG